MSCEGANHDDKFVGVVSAKARVDLRLSDYEPRAQLKLVAHDIRQPRFLVIDFHSHLDAQSPQTVLGVMDACGVEKIVNITMRTGQAAIESIAGFIGPRLIVSPPSGGWIGAVSSAMTWRNRVWIGWNA